MITPKPFNTGDTEQVEARREKLMTARDRELSDVRLTVSTRPGRRLYWRWLESAGIFQLSFDGTSRTYFNEGKRSVGLQFMADLMEAAPEQYLLMQKEAKEDQINGK